MIEAVTGEAAAVPSGVPELNPEWPEPDWIVRAADEFGYGWARAMWRQAAAAPGAWFDAAKADAVVALWPRVFVLTEDRFAGKPFPLVFWQELVVRMLVGWKTPTEILDPDTMLPGFIDVRLYRRLLLWIPRKNGKSEFLAALAILFFVLEGTEAGQGFCFARDENQAKIVLNKMKAMLSASPALKGKTQSFARSIWVPQIRALFERLSGVPQGKHGLSPTVIVGDEMHEWRSRELETFLRQGTGARLQPIELYASTAGLKSNEVGYGLFEESMAILEGRVDDPSTFVVMFAAGDEDDWQSEATWRRVNPSLGLSPTIQFLRREAAKAKDNIRAEAHFKNYHLNLWVSEHSRWIDMRRWDACAPDKTAWTRYGDELKGRKCYGALDVSATQDVTGLLWLFPPEEPGEPTKIVCRAWVPADSIEKRVKERKGSFDRWRDIGAIEATPGDYVDQDYVIRAIKDGLADYHVEKLGYDPWNASKLYTDMVKDGVDPDLFLEMRQGMQTLGEPTKTLERLIYAGQMDHGGHPLLRWMMGHAIVRFDENMNFAPAKKRSADKIDLVVCAVMACGLAYRTETAGPSFWEA